MSLQSRRGSNWRQEQVQKEVEAADADGGEGDDVRVLRHDRPGFRPWSACYQKCDRLRMSSS